MDNTQHKHLPVTTFSSHELGFELVSASPTHAAAVVVEHDGRIKLRMLLLSKVEHFQAPFYVILAQMERFWSHRHDSTLLCQVLELYDRCESSLHDSPQDEIPTIPINNLKS